MKQLLTIFLSLSLAIVATAGDWAVTVGGNSARNGISDEIGPTTDTTIWDSGPFGDFCRQGAAEGNIFAIARTFDRNDTLHGTYLYALNAYTGAELWHRDMPVDFASTDYRIQLMGINGGKVYAHDRSNCIVRLDPDTGAVLDTSDPVMATTNCYLRAAVDADGILFITIGEWPDSMLYSFDPDLTLRWSSNVPRVGASGPVLARNGILIIAGYQNDIRAYYTGDPLGTDEEDGSSPNNPIGYALYPAYPNPSNGTTTIAFVLPETTDIELSVYDIKGRKITTVTEGNYAPGEYTADVSGLESGVYLYKLEADAFADTKKLIIR